MTKYRNEEKVGTVKIGHYKFDLYTCEDLEDEQELDGQYLGAEGKIMINMKTDNPNKYRLRETVAHELLHALISVSGLNGLFKDDNEETFVTAISPYLADFLHDNLNVKIEDLLKK